MKQRFKFETQIFHKKNQGSKNINKEAFDKQVMNNQLILCLELTKTNLELSKIEALMSLKIYFRKYSFETHDNLLLIQIPVSKPKKNTELQKIKYKITYWLNRLAFTRSAFEVLIWEKTPAFSIEKTQSSFSKHLFWKEQPSFRLTTKSFGNNKKIQDSLNAITLAKNIALKNALGKVNLKTPDLDITLIKGTSFIGLGIKIWENKDPFEQRKNHLMIAPHPTGMNPRLARAMINLGSAKNEVLDPFCGAGGLLIEGANIGLQCIGTDINPKMVERAKKNTSNHKNVNIILKDALSWEKKVECVVTDVPYGKSSTLNQELKELIKLFLLKYKKLTKTIVLCCPSTLQINHELQKTGWKIMFETEIYIHSSLTRRILLLKKEKKKKLIS